MEDEPQNQPDTFPAPQPTSSPEPATTPNVTSTTHPPVTPTHSVDSAAKPSNRKNKLIIFIVVVLVVIAAAIGYKVHSNDQQTSSGKKDIPFLTYGLNDTGNMTPTYPVDSANSADTLIVDAQLFEGLVRYQDQIKITPALATSWYNPNNTTWIFNLRHGVKFNTGRTMTAADVKYSLDYAVANQNEESDSTILALADDINQVSIINPYQIKITTNGPDAVLLNQLAWLYIVDSKAKLGDPNAGTGPYSVKSGSGGPKATTLDLVASNDYWGGHVYTREVQFQEVPTANGLVADAAAGKFDISGTSDGYTMQQQATVKAKASYYQPISYQELGLQYLELNLEKPSSPLYSLAARQAMAYALNIPAILKAGGTQGVQVSQVIPSALPGYDPAIKNTPYDPAKAKQLLATVPNASTPITLVYPDNLGGTTSEMVKELDAVGFNVKLSLVSNFNTFLNQVVDGQGDMFLLGYTTDTLDGLDMINNTVAGTANYTSPQLTALINQASSTIDPTARIAVLQKLEQLVASDIPTIAMYSQTETYALNKPYVVQINIPSTDVGTYLYQVYQK